MSFISKLNDSRALVKLTKAYNLRVNKNYNQGVYLSLISLGQHFLRNNNKEIAKEYFNHAYSLAIRINNLPYQVESLGFLIDCKDYSVVPTYKRLNDSLNFRKKLIANRFSSIKYDYTEEKRKRTLSELAREKEYQAKLNFFFLFIIAIILAITYSIFQRLKHKKNIVKKVHQTESLIAKKVHDEVANDMYQTMTKLQSGYTNEEILDDLEHIYSKTRDISKRFNTINLEEGFKVVFEDLILAYKSDVVNIVTTNFSKINWKNISEIKKTVIHRVMQELLTNMKKHSKATLVIIAFQNKKNKLQIQYTDNGMGCDLKKSGGLRHTENRIQSIGGSITFESEINNGFKATIKI